MLESPIIDITWLQFAFINQDVSQNYIGSDHKLVALSVKDDGREIA